MTLPGTKEPAAKGFDFAKGLSAATVGAAVWGWGAWKLGNALFYAANTG